MEAQTNRQALSDLARQIQNRWPQALFSAQEPGLVFATGHREFDKLFPHGGIPYGQLIEITGGIVCGKTSLLFMLLAKITSRGIAAYLDYSNSFYPVAADAAGVDLSRLLVVAPETQAGGIRIAEVLLSQKITRGVVFDLVGVKTRLPETLVHRLRMKTTRAKALVIFLTESKADLLAPSVTSLRLEVMRTTPNRLQVTVARSRISPEGITTEVDIDV